MDLLVEVEPVSNDLNEDPDLELQAADSASEPNGSGPLALAANTD